jgi:beta-N-acetylhexosaminidase
MFEKTGAPGSSRKYKEVNFTSLRVFEYCLSNLSPKLKDSRARKFLFLSILAIFLSAGLFADPGERDWAEKTLQGLTLRDKIAQLTMIRVPGRFINRQSPEFLEIREQILQNHVGGVVLFAGNVYESAILLNDLQSLSKLPLLAAADFERGASFRISETTSFPWAMALGATGSEQLAYQQGMITAQESRALGVHWIFAPVMDVNNNPNNPVINIRSFGEDPMLVARLGAAFIRGAKKGGVLTAAKHFPGHGDTATDSHVGLPVVQSDLARLKSVELVPFKSAVDAGVDAIMTAHVSVPQVTGQAKLPATLSSAILSDLLRNSLKFKGLVVTDALEMGAITNRYWSGLAAVRALQAGADILLLPPNESIAINEVERAVMRGELSESRIDASVRKVLAAKSRLGLQRKRTVNINQIGDTIASPQNTKLAQEIADKSITVPKDEQHLLPVNPARAPKIFSLVLDSELDSSPGAVFQTELRRRFPSARTAWGNARISDELLSKIDKAVSESDLILCSTIVRLISGQDALTLPDSHRAIIEKIAASNKPVIWIAFGSPYVLRLAPQIGTNLCAFSHSDVSQIAAAKAIAGEIEITGRMPVTVSESTKAGDGLTIPKLEMILKPPATAELDLWERAFEKTMLLLSSLVEAKELPGAELIVGRDGVTVLSMALGKTGFAGGSSRVSLNTVYDLSSLSGIIGPATAASLAADSGNLILNTPVSDYLPEMGDTPVANLPLQELIKLMSAPGGLDKEEASATGNILQGITARTTGATFERFMAGRLFEPLGMKNSFFGPPPSYRGGIAYLGSTHSSHLFCNARNLATYAQVLLNNGVYNHQRYFKPEALARFTGHEGPWSKPSDSDWTGRVFSPAAFGHNSSSGSFFWIDPEKKLFVILLTNTQSDTGRVSETQRKVCESVISAISEYTS